MRKILVLFIIGLLASLSYAQEISPELSEQIAGLESSAETLRGLEALENVTLDFPSPEELEAYLAESFAEYYTPEFVAQEMAFYTAFGFIPADYDYLAGITALYNDQIAGFYDTETRSMNVIMSDEPTRFLSLFDQIIYVHEYTHALQDQHFDMDTFLGDSTGDAYLARLALIEGDASAVMSLYAAALADANPLGTLLQLGADLPSLFNSSLPAGTPDIIEAELTFPYIEGQSFVTALLEAGEWEQVNAAYTENPPLSSEHILHPERYFAGDAPQAISLDVQMEGWELAKEGVFGEFYLREWFKLYDLESDMIDSAATGWGGDAYQVFTNGTDSAFVLQIAFDSDADETEFLTAIETMTADDAMLLMGDVSQCWQRERVFCMALMDNDFRLTSAVDENVARALLNG